MTVVAFGLSFGSGENLLHGGVGGRGERSDMDCIVSDTNLRFRMHFDGSP